ncbi:MAG: GAF domain-containing sensor histidine kinase [Balneolaceae bacterium]|nr:GAF domain-containing sensor histidine kinase [Balneolaceae bacterium]
MKLPEIKNEMSRVIELSKLDFDYTHLEEYLGELTQMAAKVSGAPISLINLIDRHTQWTVSSEGFDIEQMKREESVCQYTIAEDNDFEVDDLNEDERFKDKPYVSGGPELRYYYGIPLETPEGNKIGALCVFDPHVRKLSSEQKELLKLIAGEIVQRLLFIQKHEELKSSVQKVKSQHRKVSHDIRGPIGGLIGLADIIKAEAEEKKLGDILEMITLIREGGQSVLDLADEIMSEGVKKEEPGKVEFNCRNLCKKLSELYIPQAVNKGVGLEFDFPSTSDPIFFSKSKLVPIVGNLISNSIKFTPQGGKVGVELQIEKNEGNNKNTLRVFVEDSGGAISETRIGEILESGNPVSELGRSDEAGFGLVLVRQLVEDMDGKIGVKPTEGAGPVFEIVVPV